VAHRYVSLVLYSRGMHEYQVIEAFVTNELAPFCQNRQMVRCSSVAVCCSVLQCIAVYCSVLQCVAVYLQCVNKRAPTGSWAALDGHRGVVLLESDVVGNARLSD